MEHVHGIDVSWLHHSSKKDRHLHKVPPSHVEGDAVPPTSSQAEMVASHEQTPLTNGTNGASKAPHDEPKPPVSAPEPQPTIQSPPQAQPLTTSAKSEAKKKSISDAVPAAARPGAPPRKDSGSQKNSPRRSSWISNLSSKFSTPPPNSSSPTSAKDPPRPTNNNAAKIEKSSPRADANNVFPPGYSMGAKENEKKDPAPHAPAPSKNPSFIQNALRRLSSSGPSSSPNKAALGSSVCERKVMNRDPNRDRSKVEDFHQSKLKRVSFCVDVEIAGVARYLEAEDETPPPPTSSAGRRPNPQASGQSSNVKKAKDKKIREKGEGAALKHPLEAVEKKQQNNDDPLAWDAEREEESKKEAQESQTQEKSAESKTKSKSARSDETEKPKSKPKVEEFSSQGNGHIGDDLPNSDEHVPKPTDIDGKGATKKKEKKKRTEEERKARKERKRKDAEANGKIPLELVRDESDWESTPNGTPPGASTPNGPRNQPTTNPLRIYRRCCQLRETPVLKRIVDQISTPTATLADAPSMVALLDLSHHSMAASDIATLADWLAVVPVRQMVLEDCGLTDETLRVILAGLLSVKTPEQSRFNRNLTKNGRGIKGEQEKLGVIEKLSLKNNNKIGVEGWRHIGLFMHLSRSLKSIDLSMIPFPPSPREENHLHIHDHAKIDVCEMISIGLAKRFGGNQLEEMMMSECSLSSKHIGQLVDGVIQCGVKRFGLANNNMNEEGVEHVVRYLNSGLCEGLDLGGNKINDHVRLIIDCLDGDNPLLAVSFADCGLNPTTLAQLMPAFLRLPNLRFIDFSHNHDLFARQPDALSLLRRYLPQMIPLKRVHLADVDLTPDHVIALAEILPECSSLCHINILDNTKLVELAKGGDASSQDEAAAMYAALMSAVRVSETIIAVDIEVPGAESSEVVKAIAKQVVAYSLRNMERGPWTDTYLGAKAPIIDKDVSEKLDLAPDILLQLVGHMDGYTENHDRDPPAPDEAYVTAGTGVVKALGVCLGTAEYRSREMSPAGSGTVTPQQMVANGKPERNRKAKDMTKNLLESARKIRARLRPALIKEDKEGNDFNYRRLLFLDQTLNRVITRFEEEYPETRLTAEDNDETETEDEADTASVSSSIGDTSADQLSPSSTIEDIVQDGLDAKLSRRASETSLHSHALTLEEGQMHRLGQNIRREILRPETEDHAHGTTGTEIEKNHLATLRQKLEAIHGDEIRNKINEIGFEETLRSIGASAKELMKLEMEDPEAFEIFKQSQIAAQLNAGERLAETTKLMSAHTSEENEIAVAD